MEEKELGFWEKTKWKLIIAVVLGVIVFIVSGAVGFPRLFRWMFVGYVFGGFLFFILLDSRPMKGKSGPAAFAGIVIFYLIISAFFTINGRVWPQYNPEEEKEKIAKLIKPGERITRGDLEAKVAELEKKVEDLSAGVVAPPPGAMVPPGEVAKKEPGKPAVAAPPMVKAPSPELIAQGREVYDLYECYNCHKVGGKGGVKRRGPELDHVKDNFNAKQLADRIWFPYTPGRKATKGFEKEFDEKVMPDYYNEQITKEEMDALVAYLLSLKKK